MLHTLSLLELKSLIEEKKASSAEIYQHFHDRAAALNGEIDAFNHIGEVPKAFETSTALAGLPIGVKDVFCEKDIVTTASSHMLEGFIPPYESTVTERLKNAGATSLGKLNLDEFAMGGSGENSATRITKNPWDLTRIPGGSSSGSAAAVSAGMVPAALGTDTGGSIRQPASMCGVVGFKPTYGRVSRYGVIAMASSLDTPGYFTRTVRDAGLLWELSGGEDPRDMTSHGGWVSIDPSIWTKKDLSGVRIGIPKEYFGEGLDSGVRREIEKAIKALESLGASIKSISLPHTQYGLSVYYIIMPAEVSTNLSRYDGIRYGHIVEDGMNIAKNRADGFGAEAQRRMLLGAHVLSSGFYDAYYRKASDVRELVRQDFSNAYEEVDVIVTPTAPTVAWNIGEKAQDPLKMYMADIFTVNASLAGIPGLALPIGTALPEDGSAVSGEMPVGLQILTPRCEDARALMVGHLLEQTGIFSDKKNAYMSV